MKLYWPEAYGDEVNFVGYNRAVKQIFKSTQNSFTQCTADADARLYCNIPYHHDPKQLKKSGLPLIAYTMFESTKMPGSWVNFLNKHVDGIIVPTQFCKDIFRMSGVKRPIKIATLGVNSNEFHFIEPKEHEGFNFLWQGHHYDPTGRKGAGLVERAFKELHASGLIPSSKLILKYRPHENFPIKINGLEAEPGIIHISDTISRSEMNNLLSTTDCCVNPSRGEGFGYIPLEQLACGLPTIVTNWSFPYINLPGCIPVDYDLKQSPTKWCYKHIALSGIGLEHNFGNAFKIHRFPKKMRHVSNGCVEVGRNGAETVVNKTLFKSILNTIADIHAKSGLYQDLRRRWRFELMFESNGLDAEANINSLKNEMLFVYKNVNLYKKKAREISETALKSFGMDRIKTEFERAINEFKTEGVI